VAAVVAALVLTDGLGRRLFRPKHLSEVATLLDEARARAAATGALQIAQTSLGVSISASMVVTGERVLDVFAFSCPRQPLTSRMARRLGAVIARQRRGKSEFFEGNGGVSHVIVSADEEAHAF
jgi:hypothetical protein